MIYLASPYSSIDPELMEYRYKAVLKEAARLITLGLPIFSPIVHCHEMAKAYDLPRDFNFWNTYCLSTLSACRELWVLTSMGWTDSSGVNAEIAFAKSVGKVVKLGSFDGENFQYI